MSTTKNKLQNVILEEMKSLLNEISKADLEKAKQWYRPWFAPDLPEPKDSPGESGYTPQEIDVGKALGFPEGWQYDPNYQVNFPVRANLEMDIATGEQIPLRFLMPPTGEEGEDYSDMELQTLSGDEYMTEKEATEQINQAEAESAYVGGGDLDWGREFHDEHGGLGGVSSERLAELSADADFGYMPAHKKLEKQLSSPMFWLHHLSKADTPMFPTYKQELPHHIAVLQPGGGYYKAMVNTIKGNKAWEGEATGEPSYVREARNKNWILNPASERGKDRSIRFHEYPDAYRGFGRPPKHWGDAPEIDPAKDPESMRDIGDPLIMQPAMAAELYKYFLEHGGCIDLGGGMEECISPPEER